MLLSLLLPTRVDEKCAVDWGVAFSMAEGWVRGGGEVKAEVEVGIEAEEEEQGIGAAGVQAGKCRCRCRCVLAFSSCSILVSGRPNPLAPIAWTIADVSTLGVSRERGERGKDTGGLVAWIGGTISETRWGN